MKKSLGILIVLIVLAVGGLWLFWEWGFCRFYVPADHMAVIIAKEGEPLGPGQILAHKGQKGVQEDVLGEGRHFLNPYLFEHQIEPLVSIPPGKVGIVTSKVGNDLPQGEFLANPGQKGISRGVLGPGKYRLNPSGYQIDVLDAISIPIGYVGVVTSLAGAKAPEGQFAGANQKGIRSDVLQPGLYYVNPKEFKVDVLEVGLNQVSMLGKAGSAIITKGAIASKNEAMNALQFKVLESQAEQRAKEIQAQGGKMQIAVNEAEGVAATPASYDSLLYSHKKSSVRRDLAPAAAPAMGGKPRRPGEAQAQTPTFVLNQFVGFPSRDGFEISLDMTVEFELLPDKIPTIFRDYGDLPAVVDKIIMPKILSISRLKGSAYRAVDFIVGEGREKFQTDLTESLKKSLAEKNISIHNALIRHVNVPDQILDPIQQASIAVEQDLTNREKQNTARRLAQLNTEQSLIEQRGAEVAQETAKLKAEIRATQEKMVAEIQAETIKQAALVEQQTAVQRAEKVKKLGKAQAEKTQMVEGEKAKGFQLKATALGDPQAYTLAELAKNLNPAVRINILHAGEGTLWTDLERATLGDLGGAKMLQKPRPLQK
ncbi:MAG: hypothetical protein EPN23_02300 [Verrucomicrobia bacterium]|nr:MAG: hypothetical protein EPN23_02300 [Verrucomicrobiota bacterium]